MVDELAAGDLAFILSGPILGSSLPIEGLAQRRHALAADADKADLAAMVFKAMLNKSSFIGANAL